MNKKGKNKKNKTQTTQNEEAKSEEKVEVIDIIESVERVPEIVSETATVVEVQDEVPQKPKRNRGKKKKSKDDDEDIMKEENVEETKSPLLEAIQEKPVESPPEEVIEEKPAEIITVVPTTRKKKNKKKGSELPEESAKGNVETVPKETPTDELSKPEVKEDILISLPTPEGKEEFNLESQELKPLKKKNKKKKRNDSEKSDNEAVSCTTAFQKLIDVTDPEEKTSEKNSGQMLLVDIPLEANVIEVKFEENKDIQASKSITTPVPVEITSNDEKEVKEASKLENKSKKNSKKDKKAKSEDAQHFELQTDEQAKKQSDIEKLTEKITEQTINIITEPLEPLLEESGPKPKATIAKPVEKKRKETETEKKLDAKEKTGNIFGLIKTEGTEHATKTEQTSKPATVEVIDILDTPSTTLQTKVDDETTQELIIPDNAMGKKRKKSPKVLKQVESSESQEPMAKIESETKQSDSNNEPFRLPVELETIKITEQRDAKPDNLKVEIIPEDTAKLSAETDIQQLSSDLSQTKDTTEDKHTKQKPGKKRKKSPRLPVKSEEIKADQPTHELVDAKHIEKQTEIEEIYIKEGKKEEISEYKAQATIEGPKLDDIEIRSLKADESEGSGCDFPPDVLYPRSTSQQRLDDNNNMVIRELMPTENILDMPIVLGFVDTPKTPEPTPEKNIIGDSFKSAHPFKMRKIGKNVDANTSKEEKTDLKSKMMEVNQDMEELRISIEKSLAELTSIETSEETVEKKFEETKGTEELPGVGETAEAKTEEIATITETPVGVPEQLKEITTETLLEVSKDNAYNTNNLKDTSELPKDKINLFSNEPLPKIDEIIEAASLSKDTSFITTQDIKKIEQTPLIEATETVAPITEEKTEHSSENKDSEIKTPEQNLSTDTSPICPARKDHKGKHKKKKGKQDSQSTAQTSSTSTTTNTLTTTTESKDTKESKKDNKTESKSDNKGNKEKGKQQADAENTESDYEPIDNFEDALTSSVDDVNRTFEMIVNETNEQTNPKINIIAPDEEKTNKVQAPKNLLGHPDIPVQSNKPDYKKEKNKIPNESQARVKIKDAINIEKSSKNTQTFTKMIKNDANKNDTEEYVYKYNFRKVFLQCACHVCKKVLGVRVACGYCNLVFYCSVKHKDEDWPQHQALCFAVSTIVHLKDQKHIYSDVKNSTGHDYRLVRMQMIVSCEKVLKRRLVPWEQEVLLYPRVCALPACRQWRQARLNDCEGCGQISYCSEAPDHLPSAHQRWCKSYSLYQKLVCYQQTKGRLEPKLPSRVMQEEYQTPEKLNEVLASMYEEKINMNDIEYAALTQIATAPLTAAFSHQLHRNKTTTVNGVSKKASCTVHVVGAELQFEADALNKWEVFFLHLRPELQELRVVLVNSNLNPSALPLELLGKIKLCENCRQKKRKVVFHFQDKQTYSEYRTSDDFVHPDLVCAFNPSIQRSSIYNGKDPWPSTIKTIIKLKTPWLVTGYTMAELHKDTIRIKECSETPFNVVSEPKLNSFASVRPDRNFISDDEMPLLFKNYCYTILCG